MSSLDLHVVFSFSFPALLGLLFPHQKEAAFGNLCFWQSIGFAAIAALGVPHSICAAHVIAITMTLLLIAIVMYCVLEFQMKGDDQGPERIPDVASESDNETEDL